MEQLWNRGGATGGKGFKTPEAPKWLELPETVAVGCHRLPFGSHGKEGVDGSSPSEGSAKGPEIGRFGPFGFKPPVFARLGWNSYGTEGAQPLANVRLAGRAKMA
jgi:hypothetical protein